MPTQPAEVRASRREAPNARPSRGATAVVEGPPGSSPIRRGPIRRGARRPPDLSAAFDAAPLAMCILSPDLRVTAANRRMAAMTGLSAETAIGRPLAEVAPALAAQLGTRLRRALRGEPVPDFEFRAGTPGGSGGARRADRVFLVSLTPLGLPGDGAAGVLCSALDVTRRRMAEAALARSEQRHRALARAGASATWRADPDGYVLEAPGWKALTGQPPEASRGHGWIEAIHPDDRVLVPAGWAHRAADAPAVDVECRARRPEGGWRWVRLRGVPVRGPSGAVEEWIGTVHDIDARRTAQQALAESEARLAQALAAAGMATWEWDPATDTLSASAGYEAMHGLPPGSLPDRTTRLRYIHPGDRAAFLVAIERVRAGKTDTYELEYRLCWPDGTVRWVRSQGRAVTAPDGRSRRVAGVLQDITARKAAEAALRESEAFSRSILENSPDCIRVHDRQGRLLYTNPAGLRLMGVEDFAQVAGRPWASFWPEEEVPKVRAAAREAVAGRVGRFTCYLPTAAGERRWWDATLCPVLDPEGGTPGRFLSILRDVTETRRAREEAEALAARLSAVLESTTDCVVVIDRNWRVTYVNRRASEMLKGRLALGMRLWEAYPEEAGGVIERHYRRALAEQVPVAFEEYLAGHDLWIEVHAFPSADGLSIFFRDVTERRRAEEERRRTQEQLAHLARHDALTGLPNRVLFRERLERGLAEAGRAGSALAVLCLDLDGFKTLNDTLGHPAGDALLCQVAERLRGCLRAGDTCARLGGDEFALIQAGIRGPEDAAALAARLVDVLGGLYEVEDQRVAVGTSVGIALAPRDGATPDELVKNADIALYRAKAEGRGTWRFFERGMDEAVRRRHELRAGLRQALDRGELELHFQPLVALRSGRVACCEALLRWRRPGRGLALPADWIPVAEETGLIVPIGRWALRAACREAARWPAAVRVAVNLSPAQFRDPGLVEAVAGALAETGLAAGRLELEITESVLLADDEANLATLHRLRGLGVRIALDDFGTGYSSLGYLLRFPFDKIKIDRSFVAGLPAQEASAAIVRAVVGLGRSLGIPVAAEGVETEAQLAALRTAGCEEAQGYLLGRPIVAPALGGILGHPEPALEDVPGHPEPALEGIPGRLEPASEGIPGHPERTTEPAA